MKTFAVALIIQHKFLFKHFSPVLEKANAGPLYDGLGMRKQNCSGAVDCVTSLDNTVTNKPTLEIKVMLKSQQRGFPCGSSFWKPHQSSFCTLSILSRFQWGVSPSMHSLWEQAADGILMSKYFWLGVYFENRTLGPALCMFGVLF